jgi:hypothetical protein
MIGSTIFISLQTNLNTGDVGTIMVVTNWTKKPKPPPTVNISSMYFIKWVL